MQHIHWGTCWILCSILEVLKEYLLAVDGLDHEDLVSIPSGSSTLRRAVVGMECALGEEAGGLVGQVAGDRHVHVALRGQRTCLGVPERLQELGLEGHT